jgi:hypothetical protein
MPTDRVGERRGATEVIDVEREGEHIAGVADRGG